MIVCGFIPLYSEVSGDREVQRTMLELLNQLDGFSSDARIKVSIEPFNLILMVCNRLCSVSTLKLRRHRNASVDHDMMVELIHFNVYSISFILGSVT